MITRPNVKINLGLHVLGKREDGFHDIETLMLPVNFFQDELEINISDRFNARIGAGWKESEDLTVRAYRQLSQTYHNMPPVSIRLVKHAPVGAGLGGGSADGAFALKMLNELCNLKMNEEVMLRQATRLGSDCPFFIHNIPMIATGKGDVLEPYDIDLKHFTVKIIVPQGIRINTAEAYKDVEDHRGMSLKEAETAFTAVVDLITEEIVEKEEAAVSGLGTFMIRSRSSRKGRNFQTGTSVQIPSSKSVGFRAGKNLKEAVNK